MTTLGLLIMAGVLFFCCQVVAVVVGLWLTECHRAPRDSHTVYDDWIEATWPALTPAEVAEYQPRTRDDDGLL